MGTPRRKFVHDAVIEPLSLAEKMKLLKSNQEIGSWMRFDAEIIGAVLDGMREILLPLVKPLDKEVSDCYQFANGLEGKLPKKRALLIFNGYDRSRVIPTIALTRSGEWFVRIGLRMPRTMNTVDLASLISEQRAEFLNVMCVAKNYFPLPTSFMWNENMLTLATYAIIPWLVETCFELVDKEVKEREERIKRIRERIDSVSMFGQALDPLRTADDPPVIHQFGIWRHHERGATNYSGNYLTLEALKPILEYLQKRENGSEYKVHEGNYSSNNIFSLLWWYARLLEDIEKGQGKEIREVVGGIGSRLPFMEGERKVLQALVESLQSK